jgi:hypothetical protein
MQGMHRIIDIINFHFLFLNITLENELLILDN